MNNKVIILGLMLFTACSNLCFSKDNSNAHIFSAGIICTSNQKRCVVGEHVIRTNGHRPLYIKDGVVCTPNRRTCTNGFSWMHSNKPLF